MDITDEMVKKKHKEFNKRIQDALAGKQAKSNPLTSQSTREAIMSNLPRMPKVNIGGSKN